MISAQEILDSQAWHDARVELEKDLLEQFQSCPPDHTIGLQGVALRFWALREVVAELERKLQKSVERQTLNR
jgi:hypothetical protein